MGRLMAETLIATIHAQDLQVLANPGNVRLVAIPDEEIPVGDATGERFQRDVLAPERQGTDPSDVGFV